jgi:peptide deformylase
VWPHKGLRAEAEPVDTLVWEEDSEDLLQLCEDLRDTLKAYNAQGLAATQIGLTKRVIVIKDGASSRVLINPEIQQKEGEMIDSLEGCLSFPGVRVRIKRFDEVVVEYLDDGGVGEALAFTGVEAVAIQHEIDHLNGVVMIDHVSRMEKNIALRRLKKIKKRLGAYR